MVANRGASQPYRSQSGGRDSGPSYDQVLQEVRNAGMISTTTSVDVAPNAGNEYLCIVRAECTMPPLREGDQPRVYSGLGAAYPRKNGQNVVHGVSNPAFYMHIAESRAKKRAWMDAVGRGDGLEENIREDVMMERAHTSAARDAAALPPPPWQMSDEAAHRIVSLSTYTFEEAKAMTKEDAKAVVQAINAQMASAENQN